MGMITNDWMEAIKPEFSKAYYKELYGFVKQEYSTHVVYPPSEDIFNAFRPAADQIFRTCLTADATV